MIWDSKCVLVQWAPEKDTVSVVAIINVYLDKASAYITTYNNTVQCTLGRQAD